MANKRIIPVDQFCMVYNVEVSFIHTLSDYGLTEITLVEQVPHIYENKIRDIEKMIRLYYDLEINIEGIQAISHLLEQVDALQNETRMLKNRLKFFEP